MINANGQALLRAPRSKRWLARVCLAGLCLWLPLRTLWIHPHYLAYFNEFVGGPANGYKYFADSNLDWGQDLNELATYIERNRLKEIKLAYFGYVEPLVYGIKYEQLQPGQPTAGVIAISVTELHEVYSPSCRRAFEWLKQYEPIAKIGYSIFVYQIPASQTLPPPIPLPPECAVDHTGSQSSSGRHWW